MDEQNLLNEMPILSSQDISSVIPSTRNTNENENWTENLLELDLNINSTADIIPDEQQYQPRIIKVTNFQDEESNQDYLANIKKEAISDDEENETEDIPYEIKYACEKSLFKTSEPIAKQPWEIDENDDEENTDDFAGDKHIELISEYEENEIFKRLKAIIMSSSHSNKNQIPSWVRRYYRKLCVRKLQRSLGKPVFNLDNYQNHKLHKEKSSRNAVVLDRFHHLISASGDFATGKKEITSTFHAKLAGSCHHELFISPHTGRVLHPFIYRNDTCVPPYVKLMCELQYEVNGRMPSRASIDYCYVRPQHIAAVNALLQRMFWPGIDSMYWIVCVFVCELLFIQI